MKSYSYKLSFLLILLLITLNTALSAFNFGFLKNSPLVQKSEKYLAKWAKKAVRKGAEEAAESFLNNTLNKIENHEEQSSLPQEEIDGLYIIKDYLNAFGYLQQLGPYDNLTNTETTSAIEIYQQNFNLEANGNLNDETIQQILIPRCGVPDINFDYNLSGTNTISWPKGNKWLPKFRQNNSITYGFYPKSKLPPKVTKVFRNAFMRWSTTTKVLNFTEATFYDDADIKIGVYIYNEAFQEVVLGFTLIRSSKRQLNFSVNSGEVLFDASKFWVLPAYNRSWSWENGEFDLETLVMHQIGHLLGLDHSFEEDSIMYPAILPSQQRKVQISVSDNEIIHQLYSTTATKADNTNYGYVGSSSGLITYLFLGLITFLAMLNY